MRRTYIKPIMDNVLFSSNEYISWCWTGTCKYHEKEIVTQWVPGTNRPERIEKAGGFLGLPHFSKNHQHDTANVS